MARSLALIFAMPLFLILVFGKRTQVPIKGYSSLDIVKETCPDECIYIEKCGAHTEKKEDNAGKSPGQNRTVAWVAPGNGLCFGGYGLDNAFCPIKTRHECLMKCGGDICASPEAMSEFPMLPPLVKVYQLLNDSTIDINSSNWTWYDDYVAKHNQNGTNSSSPN